MPSRVYLVVVLAGSLSLVTACAADDASGETPEGARDRLYNTLDDTQGVLGGSWDNQDDPTSRGCVIPLWTDGELYPALRVGPPPINVARAVESAATLWRTLGYTVEEAEINTVVELQGSGAHGEVAILRVSNDAMTLHGESECRPVG
jgi:hypothetical protein